MKDFLPALLAALLGVERAHSLMCFSCMNKNRNWYCLKPTIRSDMHNYRVTVSASAGMGNVVDFGYTPNKGCSGPCPIPSVSLCAASAGTRRCQSFLRGSVRRRRAAGQRHPPCRASGARSACCRLCCALAPDRQDPVPGPDSPSSARKESPAPPRPKRISKPPPLFLTLLSPPLGPGAP